MTEVVRISIDDEKMHPSRQALHYALNILDRKSRGAMVQALERKRAIALYADTGEISRDGVVSALEEYFGRGGELLMKRYDHYLEMPIDLRLSLLGFMR